MFSLKLNNTFLIRLNSVSILKIIRNISNEPKLNDDKSKSKSDRKELVKTKKDQDEDDIDIELWKRVIPTKTPFADTLHRAWMITSKFISSDNLFLAIQKQYDFSWQGFRRFLVRNKEYREAYLQRFIPRRHGILGPDLASAHFIVFRGGKAKFAHMRDKWITDISVLPDKYNEKYKLIALDASGCNLIYEGLDNLTLLENLEELYLSNNTKLDDWACDKIARQFRNSKKLAFLDLSDNPLITHRGIEILHRIRSLKRLVISGTEAAEVDFLELLILSFNDVNPNCEIIA